MADTSAGDLAGDPAGDPADGRAGRPVGAAGAAGPVDVPDTVGALAELYLGNILYALELASLSLEESGRGADAGFYRGIARRLARAHGAAKQRRTDPGEGPYTENSEG